MAKAIIWCRVSTEAQEFETQKADLIKRANDDGFKKEDQIIIGKAGASAIKMNDLYQKEVNELIEKIDNTPDISTIYVWEVSRLARNEVAFYQMKDKIIKNHIQLICFVPQLTLLDTNGEVNTGAEITLNLLVTLAKQEMEIKAKRFARGKKRLADDGKYNGGNIPFGYKINPETKKIEIYEPDAATVREVFNLYEGGITQPKLAKEYYRRGNRKLTISFINNILNNERYTGRKKVYQGSSYPRIYPVIITPEQYDRCRKIAKQNNTVADKARKVFFASRLIRCQECGCYWNASGSKVAYHCYDAFNKMRMYDHYTTPQCTSRLSISINIMDSLLWHVAQIAETEYLLNAAAEDKQKYHDRIDVLDQFLEAIGGRNAELDKKRARIVESYIDGDIDKEQRDKKFEKIDIQRRDILLEQANYQTEKDHIISLLEGIDDKYDISDVSEIVDQLDKITTLQKKINAITDDTERTTIVHRHVKKVTIANSQTEYTFGIGRKLAPTRFITIEFYNGKIEYYHYLSNTGKGGVVLKSNADGVPFERIVLEYLNRYVDEGKRERHQKEREERKAEKDNLYPESKYVFSYSGLSKFLGCGLSTAFRYAETLGILKPADVGIYRKEHVFEKKTVIKLLRTIVESEPKNSKESRTKAWVLKLWDAIPEENKVL